MQKLNRTSLDYFDWCGQIPNLIDRDRLCLTGLDFYLERNII
jgi:hypothetical protein